MRLIQYHDEAGLSRVGVAGAAAEPVRRIEGFESMHALATAAIEAGRSLDAQAEAHLGGPEAGTYAGLLAAGRVLPPLLHPEPARCLVSGTGLTHLGSASARDAMHAKVAGDEAALTDSMRIFKWGLDGGRPTDGKPGSQPEWFYKGDGRIVVGAHQALRSPA